VVVAAFQNLRRARRTSLFAARMAPTVHDVAVDSDAGRSAAPGPRASRWAVYDPDERSSPLPGGLVIRRALETDTRGIATLLASREGIAVEDALRRTGRDVADADTLLLVALVGGTVVGFGRAAVLTPPADDRLRAMPAGWYLLGVVVADDWRRRGIGRALTAARLQVIRGLATEAFYFANAGNVVSRRLHEGFGFVELTREFEPGVAFEGGVGILYRAVLSTAT
jgi:ribosomal protein S18 acetylase RimI-like enzyme